MVYWGDHGAARIGVAPIGGGAASFPINGAPLVDPHGLALDLAAGKMYFSDFGAPALYRANLDGTGLELLADGSDGLVNPRGVALDTAAGHMYWADMGSAQIMRANLDGSGIVEIVGAGAGLTQPVFVALELSPVPEPSSFALLLLLAGAGASRAASRRS